VAGIVSGGRQDCFGNGGCLSWRGQASAHRLMELGIPRRRGSETARESAAQTPDLMLLQELNPGSSTALKEATGTDWMVSAIDLRAPKPGDPPALWRGVAIAGRGQPPSRSWLLDGIQQADKVLLIETRANGVPFIAVSYHAPPGVSYGIVKPRQAVAFASWLSTQTGPLLFGADANTPLIDAIDFVNTRTHWHTGNKNLHGEPGDDLLFGPGKIHGLTDTLRCWLRRHPDETAKLLASHPFGPLAITHRTGKRKNAPGMGRRFDSIWVSHHWIVRHIEHLYEEGIAAGSDHAPVVVDLDLMDRPGQEEETIMCVSMRPVASRDSHGKASRVSLSSSPEAALVPPRRND
jgi:hypothetical protein